jgi:hypothetical protein
VKNCKNIVVFISLKFRCHAESVFLSTCGNQKLHGSFYCATRPLISAWAREGKRCFNLIIYKILVNKNVKENKKFGKARC